MVVFNNKSIKVNMNVLSNNLETNSYSVDELLNGIVPVNLIDQKTIDNAFAYELEELLKLNSLYELSRAIINLEQKLNRLEKYVQVDLMMPNLNAFYSSLSPVFLQSFVETNGNMDKEDLQNNWLEAVRIAIEEELIIWQEKTESEGH